MGIDRIKRHFEEAGKALNEFVSQPANLDRIEQAGRIISHAIDNGNKVIACGNGGSMCDAMHFAEEMTGRFRDDRPAIPAIAISDPAHITCTANDYGFQLVFSRFVEAHGNEGDVLLAISTSGNSANVIKAIEAARERGMKVVGLTGRDGGQMAPLCDVEIRAPGSDYADRVQEIHIKVIHTLIDLVENR